MEPETPTPVQIEIRDDLYHLRSPDSSVRSLSPSKSMPNFTHQHSVEGDSIFGYKPREAREHVGKAKGMAEISTKKDKGDDARKEDPKKAVTPKTNICLKTTLAPNRDWETR